MNRKLKEGFKMQLIIVPMDIKERAKKRGHKNSTKYIESLLEKDNPLHDNQSY